MEAFTLLRPTIIFLCFLSFIYVFLKTILMKKTATTTTTTMKRSSLDLITDYLLASPTNTITISSTVMTANPDNIEHILKTNFDNYPKGEDFSSTFRDLLGGGIFNSDGDHWKIQRKTASLQFNTKSIRAFVIDNVQLELVERLQPTLSKAANSGGVIDLQDVLERFSFDNVCKVAFDVDPARLCEGGDDNDSGRFARAFEAATAICTRRFQQPRLLWRSRRALRLGDEGRLRKEMVTINEFAMRVVKERRARERNSVGGSTSGDLLSKFIGEGEFSDDFLRDIVISFVLAGRDTTSTALTWFFYIVSSRPDVRQKIMDEIRTVRSKHADDKRDSVKQQLYTLEELREMEYLHAALSEALRIYPPVVLQPRCCAADDVLPDGTVVKKGWTVMYNTYAMGRMKSIWGKDCEEYRPERWMEKGVFQPKSPYRFPIFHAGPRMCLGKEMAYIQMKAVATAVIERFEIEVAEEEEKKREHDFTIILRMKGGLPVRVKERRMEDGDVATVM